MPVTGAHSPSDRHENLKPGTANTSVKLPRRKSRRHVDSASGKKVQTGHQNHQGGDRQTAGPLIYHEGRAWRWARDLPSRQRQIRLYQKAGSSSAQRGPRDQGPAKQAWRPEVPRAGLLSPQFRWEVPFSPDGPIDVGTRRGELIRYGTSSRRLDRGLLPAKAVKSAETPGDASWWPCKNEKDLDKIRRAGTVTLQGFDQLPVLGAGRKKSPHPTFKGAGVRGGRDEDGTGDAMPLRRLRVCSTWNQSHSALSDAGRANSWWTRRARPSAVSSHLHDDPPRPRRARTGRTKAWTGLKAEGPIEENTQLMYDNPDAGA